MGRDHRRSDDIQRRIAIAQGPRKRRPHTRPRRGVALAGTPGVRTGPDAGSAPYAVARCTRFSGRMPESGGDSRRGIRTGTYDAESRRAKPFHIVNREILVQKTKLLMNFYSKYSGRP